MESDFRARKLMEEGFVSSVFLQYHRPLGVAAALPHKTASSTIFRECWGIPEPDGFRNPYAPMADSDSEGDDSSEEEPQEDAAETSNDSDSSSDIDATFVRRRMKK